MSEENKHSEAEKYVNFCGGVLSNLKATLASESNTYVLSDEFVEIFLRMKRMAEPPRNSKEDPFSHELQVRQVFVQIKKEIDASMWAFMFKKKAANLKNEIEEQEKARIADARGPKATLKYEDCKEGEYVSYDKERRPNPTFINAQLVLRDLGVIASYNEFTEKKVFQLNGKDIDVGTLRNKMWDKVFVDFAERTVLAAMDAHSRRFAFHPIKNYFESVRHLKPKGVIDNWLTKVVGAEDNILNREIGKKFFVAMVARIYEPGRKFDQMIVLESKQGMGKSTLLEIIAGTEYFNSGKILSMESKEQMEALKGRMIYESADLVGHGKADVDSVKAFLSQTADRGRWAYATEVKDHPRTAIIVGTTNKNVYLLDETGNRRIWPILCNCVPTETTYEGRLCSEEVNLPWVRENRDQLFSEALALYESGYPLTLARELWGDVTILQNDRMVEIPMTDEAWEVFGLTAQEGLLVVDNPELHQMNIRIFTRDIIRYVFPTIIANTVIGKNIKTAMANINVIDGLKWMHKNTLRIDDVVGSGWELFISKKEHYDFVKKTMAGWKRRRQAKGIANATM